MYSESLGRWRTADLLIGLAYLARQEGQEHPVADIARQAKPIGLANGKGVQQQVLDEMRQIQRFMGYCLALRERRPAGQQAVFNSLGIEKGDVLMQEPRAGVLRPSFCLVRDDQLQMIVLAIRGTHSLKDMFTSLTGTSKPHHMVDPESGVVLGYCHFGMLAAARWLLQQVGGPMRQALQDHPGYQLKIIGHSLGGGTAAALTMMMRESPEFAQVTCLAIACPSCMTLDLARSCSPYVTTIINGADLIPTVSAGSADTLRAEVMQSSWYDAFRSDMRSNVVVRAVEGSLGQLGRATQAATSWTSSYLTFTGQGLKSCYARTPRFTRKRSHQDFMDLAEEPLSPVLRPPRQTMHSHNSDSASDGDEVMGTGIASPRSQVELASEWALLDPETHGAVRNHPRAEQFRTGAEAFRPKAEDGGSGAGPGNSEGWDAAPSWGQVLGNLKTWGISPASQSAAASPVAGKSPATGFEDATAASEAVQSRPASANAAFEASEHRLTDAAADQQRADRLTDSLDTGRVGTSGSEPGWGLGRVTGWGQRAGQTTKAVGEKVGQSGKTAYRSFVSRWWLQDCRPDPYRVSDFDEGRAGAEDQQGLLASGPAPQAMHMHSDMTGLGDGDEGQQPGGHLPSPSQVDDDMREAQAAAEELEAEARAQGTGPDQDPGHLPGLEESLQRRTMYPAGRILHLVPACLVFSEEELQKYDPPDAEGRLSAELDPQAAAALQAATPVSPGPSWPKPPLWSSGPFKKPLPSSSSSSHASAAAADGHQAFAGAADAEAAIATAALSAATLSPQTPLELAASVVTAAPGMKQSQEPNPQQDVAANSTQHAQQQPSPSDTGKQRGGQQSLAAADTWGGIQYDSNVADIDGTLHVFSDTGISDAEEDLPPADKQKYVLLDRVPQEAYGRIKLCSSMIQDHFIPMYSANMQTAMAMYTKYSR